MRKQKPAENVKEMNTAASFPIVGIGASAGGLGAFEAFFSGMPLDLRPEMAFVLVQHLASDRKSILGELIQGYTSMRVIEVEDGMIVEPNCVYIKPPGYNIAFLNGHLQLFQPSMPPGQRLPIDLFFHSLAQDQGDRAIGIVLSGTGSDGTLGVRAIKSEGGMVMVQTPDSADYDGMSRSAIATGLADYELPPAKIAEALLAYTQHAFTKDRSADDTSPVKFEDNLKKILTLVRAHTGHDFSSYKSNTIQRRVVRRMAVHQIDTIEEYLALLQKSDGEIDALFKDLLIGVTNFFRDGESFKALETDVIPRLFAGKSPGSPVRAWSAGCSTGEEAYSIAILMQEHMEVLKQSYNVQVFATDIDPYAITAARAGMYPASVSADITPKRLERFFSSEPEQLDKASRSYQINKSIRDMLIFSEQNIINDPPFSRMDLICCRNLMIYLSSDLQKKLIPLFHYALNPGGFLFLGTSETIGDHSDLFQLIDRKSKLYLRKDSTHKTRRAISGNFFPAAEPHSQNASQDSAVSRSPAYKSSTRELAEQTLLKFLSPSSALVNSKGDIFYLHGRTGSYLEPVVGEVRGYNIIKMAREGLRHGLTAALKQAVEQNAVIHCKNQMVKSNGGFMRVDISVCPAAEEGKSVSSNKLYLVVLEERKDSGHSQEAKRADLPAENTGGKTIDAVDDDLDTLVTSLREELQSKDQYLRTAIEELETSNEELKSTNEEMQSVNEELQSTNEELETSKEELQSVNEELSTVNNELSAKIADLSRANNDMNNLLAGTGIATVFVNHRLQILRFTPTASVLINLIQGDIGRPVNHILTNMSGYNDLAADIQSVLDTLIPKTIEVQTISGEWYRMSISPYRTLDNVIEGAVINFVNITESLKLREELKKQLSEKMVLLREVHHRVKNNIANIESLLSLQAETSANPDVKNALEDAHSRVQSIRILYDKLLTTQDYNEISVQSYVENLLDSLSSVYNRRGEFTIQKEFTNFTITPKNANTLGIIINELLTNVFKYAFKNRPRGKVFISIGKTENMVTLTIKDDGVGIDDSKELSGFGLTIVQMLVKQLNGTFSMVNENGTKSTIQFEL